MIESGCRRLNPLETPRRDHRRPVNRNLGVAAEDIGSVNLAGYALLSRSDNLVAGRRVGNLPNVLCFDRIAENNPHDAMTRGAARLGRSAKKPVGHLNGDRKEQTDRAAIKFAILMERNRPTRGVAPPG